MAQWFWGRRWKCEKFMTMSMPTSITTDTDKFWSEKFTWAFGSGELKIWSKSKFEVDRPVLDLLHSTKDFSSFILLADVGMLILNAFQSWSTLEGLITWQRWRKTSHLLQAEGSQFFQSRNTGDLKSIFQNHRQNVLSSLCFDFFGYFFVCIDQSEYTNVRKYRIADYFTIHASLQAKPAICLPWSLGDSKRIRLIKK